jgi:ankyrin repeat protein
MTIDDHCLCRVPNDLREQWYAEQLDGLEEGVIAWLTALKASDGSPLLPNVPQSHKNLGEYLSSGKALSLLVEHFFPHAAIPKEARASHSELAGKWGSDGRAHFAALSRTHFFLSICREMLNLPSDLIFDEQDLLAHRKGLDPAEVAHEDDPVRWRNVLLTISLYAGWLDAHGATDYPRHRGEFHVQPEDTLHFAIAKGDLEEVKQIRKVSTVEEPFPINSLSVGGWPALYAAAYYGFPDLVEFLLESGADVDGQTASGWSPIHAAAAKGYLGCLRHLHAHSVDLEAYSPKGCTALYYAAAKGHPVTVSYLIEVGANVDGARDEIASKPLHGAAHGARTRCASVLIDAGADPNVRFHAKRYTPLHLAITDASHGDDLNREVFLESFIVMMPPTVDWEARAVSGATPLALAAMHGNASALELLLLVGARADTKTNHHQTAIELAEANGHLDCANMLYEALRKVGKAPLVPPALEEPVGHATKFRTYEGAGAPPTPDGTQQSVKGAAKWLVKRPKSGRHTHRRASHRSVTAAKVAGKVNRVPSTRQ